MVRHDEPDDFVIATGERHSVREFVERVFETLELSWQDHVETDSRYLRPAEVDVLQGDASKAERLLGWKPKTTFDQLIDMMVESDMALAEQEKTLVNAGLKPNEWRNGRP